MMMGIGFELTWYFIFTICFFIAFCGADWFFAVLDFIDSVFEYLGGYTFIRFVEYYYDVARSYGSLTSYPLFDPVTNKCACRKNRRLYSGTPREIELSLWKILQEIEHIHEVLDRAEVRELQLVKDAKLEEVYEILDWYSEDVLYDEFGDYLDVWPIWYRYQKTSMQFEQWSKDTYDAIEDFYYDTLDFFEYTWNFIKNL